jgi:hypothetical protein
MIKLIVDPIVLTTLKQAMPKTKKAEEALEKYILILERHIDKSLMNAKDDGLIAATNSKNNLGAVVSSDNGKISHAVDEAQTEYEDDLDASRDYFTDINTDLTSATQVAANLKDAERKMLA